MYKIFHQAFFTYTCLCRVCCCWLRVILLFNKCYSCILAFRKRSQGTIIINTSNSIKCLNVTFSDHYWHYGALIFWSCVSMSEAPDMCFGASNWNIAKVDLVNYWLCLLCIWQEREMQEEELKAKEAELLKGNPLLNNPTSFNVKRRWDDDVVFKNQARGETKTPKRFINDTIRNDFHRKFLQKYMK